MKRVLYIEDNEDNIFMLKMRLERKGYEVHIAKDGNSGYEASISLQPDIILLDVGLPDMDGYETARKIRADSKILHIPIIMITAQALSDDKEKAFEAGAQEYEPKPVNFDGLLEKIETLTSKE